MLTRGASMISNMIEGLEGNAPEECVVILRLDDRHKGEAIEHPRGGARLEQRVQLAPLDEARDVRVREQVGLDEARAERGGGAREGALLSERYTFGQRRSEKVREGQRRSKKVREGSEKVSEGQRTLENVRERQRRLVNA